MCVSCPHLSTLTLRCLHIRDLPHILTPLDGSFISYRLSVRRSFLTSHHTTTLTINTTRYPPTSVVSPHTTGLEGGTYLRPVLVPAFLHLFFAYCSCLMCRTSPPTPPHIPRTPTTTYQRNPTFFLWHHQPSLRMARSRRHIFDVSRRATNSSDKEGFIYAYLIRGEPSRILLTSLP